MTVFGMVSAVAGLIKIRYLVNKAMIDNMVLRTHYWLTLAILFVSCIIVTANNLIGYSIQCIHNRVNHPHVINTFCWITYSFTLPHEQDKTYHSYYEWVPFMLLTHGVMFYFPHWIWKNWEQGKLRMITEGLRGSLVGGKDERKGRQNMLLQYSIETMHLHNTYTFGYFLREVLNFVDVIINITMTDKFLGGTFMTYGTEVIRFSNKDQENRTDPMVSIFSRISKCTFTKFVPSGTIQKHGALCILVLNFLNEKIYIFLWFWLIIVAFLSGLAICYYY
ncbi:hypothetical protein WA026_004576 [Henosepilachna vigintioctopunctata]|uniref:Innexin n=1 Tax=Henosepilachna vigintioctopunctata TaxID=420089 RepID=A0AAW1V8C7_9CUCU